MLDSEYFSQLAQSEGFAELTPYIENGTLNVDGMDLSAGYVINQDTGKKILYGIPAQPAAGAAGIRPDRDDFCLGVSVAGENARRSHPAAAMADRQSARRQRRIIFLYFSASFFLLWDILFPASEKEWKSRKRNEK